jgi:peptide/nickel transport system substrate-binding protein
MRLILRAMNGPPDGGPPPGDPQAPTSADADVEVRAFLIADVRGWTAFTQEHGDEGAARLAARFANVTRAVVEDHRGRVVELRGDEALVVFGSPRSAIRGAVALQQRFVEETIADPSLPLTVGVGLDAGEAVPVEGGYRGGALNVAARLCSIARAGEVLASREIVHLARRIDGLAFVERGAAPLKGLEKPVHVVAVRSEDRDDAAAIAPFVRPSVLPRAPRWRSKVVVGAISFAVLAAVIAVPLARRGGGDSEIEPDSIGVLDAETGELTTTIELDSRPGSVAASEDAVWVTNPDIGTVTRIDPIEQELRGSVPVGENPTGIAVGEDAVWVVESGGPSVSRISPATNEVVDTIPVGNGPADVAVGLGSVWVTNRFDGTVSRIDSEPSGGVETITVGLDPRGIAIGFGQVWVAVAGSNTLVGIDPDTNEIAQRIGVGNAPGAVAVSEDAVWVVNTVDDTVSEVSPDTDAVVDTIQVGDGPSGIAVMSDVVWVANEEDATLSTIKPGQATAQGTRIGSVPQGLAGVNGELWVSVRGAASSHLGGTLRVVSALPLTSIDATATYDPEVFRLLRVIGDGLVDTEAIGGADATLVANLAQSVPTSIDGRTYTFELRPNIRYSNGEVVAPGDFRRAFERGFRVYPSNYRNLYGGIVGAEACRHDRDTCDLSLGIETDDVTGEITFHLVDPDPEFLFKLTMPFSFPVPASVPEGRQPTTGVPGTGPYMLAGPLTPEGIVLVRNPHFRVWSAQAQPDGNVDRIEWTFGVEPDAQVEAVIAAGADIALDAQGAGVLDDILIRYPAQVHASQNHWTVWVVFDTDSPPFESVEARQAVNFALDRRQAAQLLGGEPTCQQLPPNFPGYEPYCPYTLDPGPDGAGVWTAPDLGRAQMLVRRSGTRGMHVTVSVPGNEAGWASVVLADSIVEVLNDLGYRASRRSYPIASDGSSFNFSPDNPAEMKFGGWISDYPAASSFFVGLATCGGDISPQSGFCDAGIDEMIGRAAQIQFEDPVAAAALWAEVDRAVVDQAPYLWLANPIAIEFVSERVGNFQFRAEWGVLLDQIWVR